MRRILVAGLGAALVVSTAGCGSTSHQDAAAQTATSSLKAELLHQSSASASAFTFTDAQAQCAASRVVNAIGTSGLQRYGLLSTENKATTKTLDDTTLSRADASTVVTAIIECLGAGTFTRDLTTAVSKSITGTQTASQRACLESKLTVDALKPMLIDTLSGNQVRAQTFYLGLASCIPKK